MLATILFILNAVAQPPTEYVTGYEIQKPFVVSAEVPQCRDPYEKAIARKTQWSQGLLVIATYQSKLLPTLINDSKIGKDTASKLELLKINLEAAHSGKETQGLKKFVSKIVTHYYKKNLKKKPPKSTPEENKITTRLLKAGYDGGKFCPIVKIKKSGELKVSVKTQAAVMRDVLKELAATRKFSKK